MIVYDLQSVWINIEIPQHFGFYISTRQSAFQTAPSFSLESKSFQFKIDSIVLGRKFLTLKAKQTKSPIRKSLLHASNNNPGNCLFFHLFHFLPPSPSFSRIRKHNQEDQVTVVKRQPNAVKSQFSNLKKASLQPKMQLVSRGGENKTFQGPEALYSRSSRL